jgi:hypothetical protein
MGEFLTPVLALIIWTFIMWVVMYKRRIPAMQAISKDPQDFVTDPNFGAKLPASARWAADNYNHLHEQPVVFYALMFYLQISGHGDNPAMYMAWAYVAIRVVHSIVQITSNKVMVRFSLFVISTLVLIVMALRAAVSLF